MATINLPAGDYIVYVTIDFLNYAKFFGQDNHRVVACSLTGSSNHYIKIDGADTDSNQATLAFHEFLHVNQARAEQVLCGAIDGGTDTSWVCACETTGIVTSPAIELSAIALSSTTFG